MALAASNPALSRQFEKFDVFSPEMSAERADVMTIQGTVLKTGILLALTMASAIWSWSAAVQGTLSQGVAVGASLAGFVIVLILMFKAEWAKFLAPVYAACMGVFLGYFSLAIASYTGQGQSIVFNAVLGTMGVLVTMLGLYSSGVVKVTDKMRMFVMAAAGGLICIYMASFIMRMFGMDIPYIHGSGPIGIGFSLFAIGLGSFFLLLDFDDIDRGVKAYAPKWMEWYGAFGLMVSLVYLYIHILSLLAKLQSSD